MRRLASPGFQRSALIGSILTPSKEMLIEFKGLNRKSYTEQGEMPDMLNLASDEYPLLAPRKLRGLYKMPEGLVRPLQILSRYNKLAIIGTDSNNDVNFYYDGVKIDAVNDLNASSGMTAINTKIVFMPQKTYLEIFPSGTGYTIGNYGSLEANVTCAGTAIDISGDYAKITLQAGHGLKYDDAIKIEGTLAYTAGGQSKTAAANTSLTIDSVENDNTIVFPKEVFIELIGEGATNVTLTGNISRTMPDLDHIIEWNNRLWGASNADNTIYACKLGDPTNWQYFQGTSIDSFYAQQGTDGRWSGVAAYSGHVIFFKPHGMCRVYGTAPSNFQVTSTKCFGVEEGSRLSVVTINDTVYYKSTIGIMAYAGGNPVCISENLGQDFGNVVAGSEGIKYYASVQRKTAHGGFEVLVFDIDRGLWHKEDNVRFKGSCAIENKLHFIEYNEPELLCSESIYASPYLVMGDSNKPGNIRIINSDDPDEQPDGESAMGEEEQMEHLEWMAQFGPFHEYLEEKKIYSKLALRLKANAKSVVKVYMSIDDGEWELVKMYDFAATGGEVIPIIPRRCDRYSIRIEGKGDCEIVSLTRRVRQGTFSKL